MSKDEINKCKASSLSKIEEAIRLLSNAEGAFNDSLTDDDGKSVELEYNSIYNAIQSLKTAKRELSE